MLTAAVTAAAVDGLVARADRVIGMRLRTANGPREVGDELVLSTGAISSPTILLLSGSAPARAAPSRSRAAVGARLPGARPTSRGLWLVLQRTRGVGLVG